MVIPYAYADVEVLGLPLVPVTALLCNPTPGPISVVLCAPVCVPAAGAVCAPEAGAVPAPTELGVAAPPALSGVAVLLVPATADVVP